MQTCICKECQTKYHYLLYRRHFTIIIINYYHILCMLLKLNLYYVTFACLLQKLNLIIIQLLQTMDFFNDDFGFGDSPRKPLNKNMSKKSQTNKSVKGADEFDDLLDELLVKEKKKTQKQKNNQPSMTTKAIIDKNPSPVLPSSNQKWQSVGNINTSQLKFDPIGDAQKNYQPMRNRQSSRSIYDDKASQDNRSNKSGATAKASLAGLDNIQFLRIPSNTDIGNQQPSSSLRGMKPPMRRRNQSKVGFDSQEDLVSSIKIIETGQLQNEQDYTNINLMRPPLPRKQPSPPQKIGPSGSQKNLQPQPHVIQKEKIVYIKQDQKNVRQQHEKQIKLIKQSHQKQMNLIREELERQVKNGREIKLKIIKECQEQRQKDRILYEKLSKKQEQKLKELYEWEIKRKSQSYELEIQRLKRISEIGLKAQQKTDHSYINYQSQKQQLKLKEKELQKKIRKLGQQQSLLKEKEKSLQIRQQQFNAYRKREEQKIHEEKKNLYKLENQIQKKKLQFKKVNEENKMSIASDLSKQELEIMRQKQQMKIEKQELQISLQLFEKQKKQYEQFNANIMKQYKRKLKLLEEEKNYYQEKQIQLYKKIQTVEMMADLKSGKRTEPKLYPRTDENKSKNYLNVTKLDLTSANVQNVHSLSPLHLQESNYPKNDETMKQMRASPMHGDKTNLKDYLLKINRDNTRMRPFLV